MISPTTIVLTALLVGAETLGSALPAGAKIGTTVIDRTDESPGRASFKQIRNPHYVFNGALSVYKTYLKFGVPPPDHLRHAVANITLARRATGSAPAVPIDEFDDAYVTPVSIGTPPQTLNLDFDTGSSDLWVFSSQVPKSQVNGQTIYNPGSSSTAQLQSGATWSITYGDGSASRGNVYKDKVRIGGLTVAQQAVEAAQQVSASFTRDSEIDGLLGLGFDALNTVKPQKQATWFTNIKPSLDAPLFTADLKYHAAGTYNFGYIDSAAYTGSITYTSVNTSPGYWTFTSSGYGVGTGSFSSTSITGIADTGTTLLYLPTAVVRAYYAKVSGSSNSNTYGGYVFPCSAAASLPSFTFGIGSARITIPGSFINYGVVEDGSTTCFGGIQSSSGIGINIFGDVALKAAFVVFNGGSPPTLGWASKRL